MAWTHVGSQSAGTTSSTTTQPIDLPAGSQEGDLALIVATVNDNDPATATTQTTPTGVTAWTAVGGNPENGASGSFMSSVCYWHILDATDIGTSTMVVDFSGFRSNRVAITVWRAGGAISLDVSAVSKGTGDGNPTPVTITGVTTTQANDLIIIAGSFSQGTATYNFESGYTNQTTGVSGSRNVAIFTSDSNSAGATGALDCSILNDFFGYVGYAVAFKEAATAKAPPPSRPINPLIGR